MRQQGRDNLGEIVLFFVWTLPKFIVEALSTLIVLTLNGTLPLFAFFAFIVYLIWLQLR